jgi:hypothetical protein
MSPFASHRTCPLRIMCIASSNAWSDLPADRYFCFLVMFLAAVLPPSEPPIVPPLHPAYETTRELWSVVSCPPFIVHGDIDI